MTRGRVLLESSYCWQWYLGDRVLRQSLGLDAFLVPGPLPSLVLTTSEYTLEEVERFTQPDPQLEPLFQAGADYAEYRSQHLMRGFGICVAWEATQQARGNRGGRGRRGGKKGDGGREGGDHGDGTGQSGGRLPTLSWMVDVMTAQGVPGLVEVSRPTVEPPEFLS